MQYLEGEPKHQSVLRSVPSFTVQNKRLKKNTDECADMIVNREERNGDSTAATFSTARWQEERAPEVMLYRKALEIENRRQQCGKWLQI